MPTNRGVAYIKPGTVEVKSIDYPKLRMPKSETDPFGGKDAPHGVILKIVTTNCGTRVDRVNPERQSELFAELEKYGVRHEDRNVRNITYRVSDGRFCIIDFEFATILGDGADAVSLKPSAAQ